MCLVNRWDILNAFDREVYRPESRLRRAHYKPDEKPGIYQVFGLNPT